MCALPEAKQRVSGKLLFPKLINRTEATILNTDQNNNLKTAITGLKPQYTLGNQLIYKYSTESSFWAGNEYLFFENNFSFSIVDFPTFISLEAPPNTQPRPLVFAQYPSHMRRHPLWHPISVGSLRGILYGTSALGLRHLNSTHEGT